MPRVFISLGSNLGDRRAYLEQALKHLDRLPATKIVKVSSIYASEAVTVNGEVGPEFLNAVCCVTTGLLPRELLDHLQEIERGMGRQRHQPWGPRTIDLDILSYGDQQIEEPHLVIPHPRMHDREFVLRPLREIAPGWRHPVMMRSVRELLEGLADSSKAGKVLACCGSFY